MHLQTVYTERFGKSIENSSDEVEEQTENFSQTPEIPMFLRTEAVKTPDSLEKIQFPKTPTFEMWDILTVIIKLPILGCRNN